jgi:hypothetical protein
MGKDEQDKDSAGKFRFPVLSKKNHYSHLEGTETSQTYQKGVCLCSIKCYVFWFW